MGDSATTPETESRAPALIVVAGMPGAGKTTLAIQIASERPAVRFCPDDWLEALGRGIWDGEMRERIEHLQKSLATDVLRAGSSAVIEWGTWGRDERDELRDLAHSLGARAELIVFDLPVEILFERVAARNAEDPPITEAQMREWDRVFQRADAVEGRTYDAFQVIRT